MYVNKEVTAKRGIWCLETVWFNSTSNASVRPVLELVNALYGTPFVHRNAVSRDEFFCFLDAWLQSGDNRERYPILLLSYHGSQGTISLKEVEDDDLIDWEDEESWDDPDSMVALSEIRDALGRRCNNRVVHFSSCSSLDVSHDEINDFIDATDVSAISGYTKNVDWTQALAVDLLYLEQVQTANFVNLTPKLMSEVYDLFKSSAEGTADLSDDVGYLPTADMVRRMGFNLRVQTVPAS